MRPIDKFILHVVHNWKNELNEAYSEGAVKKFIEKFREEADDLNIQITDEQLKSYIQRFDVLKNSPKITEKDLNKWSIGQLIRLVTSSKGTDTEEKEDDTPDVVYNDNGITIWNGSKEGNCITYGQDERWCITRGSYSNYRYSQGRGYPTFYLAKNTNLSDSDKLSFVAIQVRDADEDEKYVYTNRQNSPNESDPMSFSELTSEVPWLRNIPNLKNILKYIPLSSTEKVTQLYKSNSITIRDWMKLPFETKKQYLVVRKDRSELFSDIENNTFVSKYLPKYPQIANFIAITPGVVDFRLLLANLDKFDNQDRKSIISNLTNKVSPRELESDSIPFDAKKLLVYLNKWDISPDQRLYVTKDGSTIVKLKLGDNISISLYQAEDDYPNIKLNQRTSKYLLDYPELDKIPLRNLVKLAGDGTIDRSVVTKVIDSSKNNPNSALIVKPTEDGEIILDSNSFTSYKVDKNGGLFPIPFGSEEVQQVFADAKDNESFQQNALSLFKTDNSIPSTIDKEALISVVNAVPYNQRILQYGDIPVVVLTTNGKSSFFTMPSTVNPRQQRTIVDYGRRGDWRGRDTNNNLDADQWKAYFDYLRNTNQVYDSNGLKTLLGTGGWQMDGNSKKAFISNNPPVANDSQYKPTMNGDTALLINTADPRNSFKISDQSGKLIKANIPPSLSRQLLGQAAPAAAAAAAPAGRRGRPAGGGQPRAAAPAAPAAAGNINVPERMQETGLETAFLRLPRADYRRLAVANATRVDPNGDRGAARRNNQLGNRGRVGQVIQIGASKIYIIRLANQQIIASINVQPGNRNYVLFGNENGNVALPLNSPAELVNALQQRNLAEMRRYLTQEYLANNPEQLEEVRGLLQQYVTETKNN